MMYAHTVKTVRRVCPAICRPGCRNEASKISRCALATMESLVCAPAAMCFLRRKAYLLPYDIVPGPTGDDEIHQANDRRVEVFFKEHEGKTKLFCPQVVWHFGTHATQNKGDGGMSAYCGQTIKWQDKNFQKSWFDYPGTPYPDGEYPAAKVTMRNQPPPAKVLGLCSYKGASGQCVHMNECGTTSYASSQGATGCQKFAWNVQCCVFSCKE